MTPVRRALLVAGVGGVAAAAGYFANLWRIGAAGQVPAGDAAAAAIGAPLVPGRGAECRHQRAHPEGRAADAEDQEMIEGAVPLVR
ncbi:MAG: hypothetical protein ACO3F9_12755, partial [Burkholderiales bacterium]